MAQVNIFETNGALGSVGANKDGVAALIGDGIAVASKFALGDVLEIYSVADAEALGIDADYDTANSTTLHANISAFYDEAGTGAKLFFMVVANTVPLATIADKTELYAAQLLEQTNGEVRLLAITGSSPVSTDANGFDDDAFAAIAKAQELAEDAFAKHQPIQVLIPAKGYTGVLADLIDLHTLAANRVSVYLGNDGDVGGAFTNIGLLLGRLAAIPVQRNAGRVKDGALNLVSAGLTDGTLVADLDQATIDVLAAKGYILPRQYYNRSGFYFFDDFTCAPLTDDYAYIGRGRVMDKAHRIAYDVFTEELLDDIDVDATTGQMEASVIKSFQAKCEDAIAANMINDGKKEISSVEIKIDPLQNVLATSKVTAKLRLVPKGVNRDFEIEIGFNNPFNT